LIMGTRCGDIDPAAVEYIRAKLNKTPEDMVQYLNKECGMLGISEYKSDMRNLTERYDAGDEKSKLAIEMTAYRIKKYIGSYAAVLGGVDAIIFTGGIGENSSLMRELVMDDMQYLGVDFDFEENLVRKKGIRDISKNDSKVKVLILPTN
ncbi:MAG: acetate kinase, partial [Clostridia bacterium]